MFVANKYYFALLIKKILINKNNLFAVQEVYDFF